jgi:hypothetical protein
VAASHALGKRLFDVHADDVVPGSIGVERCSVIPWIFFPLPIDPELVFIFSLIKR